MEQAGAKQNGERHVTSSKTIRMGTEVLKRQGSTSGAFFKEEQLEAQEKVLQVKAKFERRPRNIKKT